jgi:hypothetical protein
VLVGERSWIFSGSKGDGGGLVLSPLAVARSGEVGVLVVRIDLDMVTGNTGLENGVLLLVLK